MSDFVFETQHTIHIKITDKPHADGRFYIRLLYLEKAKKYNKKIIVEYQGQKYICSYKEWMKDSKKMEKVFLIPEHPMILYGNYIRRFIPKKPEVHIEGMMNIAANMPEKYFLQAKAKLGLL
jgi:hypothetical protein